MNDRQVRFAKLTDHLEVVTAEVDALKASLTRLQDQVDKLKADAELLEQDLQACQ